MPLLLWVEQWRGGSPRPDVMLSARRGCRGTGSSPARDPEGCDQAKATANPASQSCRGVGRRRPARLALHIPCIFLSRPGRLFSRDLDSEVPILQLAAGGGERAPGAGSSRCPARARPRPPRSSDPGAVLSPGPTSRRRRPGLCCARGHTAHLCAHALDGDFGYSSRHVGPAVDHRSSS